MERSIDGVTFEPWQYYAITDTECMTRFNIIPRRGNPSYTRDDEVICTSFYSKIHPLEDGEVNAGDVEVCNLKQHGGKFTVDWMVDWLIEVA